MTACFSDGSNDFNKQISWHENFIIGHMAEADITLKRKSILILGIVLGIILLMLAYFEAGNQPGRLILIGITKSESVNIIETVRRLALIDSKYPDHVKRRNIKLVNFEN